jgi:hypothetical protein
LRFLSKTKIQENRYRFMSKKSEQKQLYEEAIQRAKEYQTKILNPSKLFVIFSQGNQVRNLCQLGKVLGGSDHDSKKFQDAQSYQAKTGTGKC